MILKIFSPKNLAKILAFLTQNKALIMRNKRAFFPPQKEKKKI
jgi:hypothetical protein